MPIDFPNNPISGQTYSYAGQQWEYNGVAWDKLVIADDVLKLVGVSGEQYLGELQTGILYGGVLSINAGNTATFDYTAGAGFIAYPGATLTAMPTPTGQTIQWSGATGVTLANLATADTTWLRIDSSGTLIQSSSAFTNGEYQNSIVLGALIHPTRSYISIAKTFPITSYGSGEQYEIFIRSFGGLKLSGHVIEASATPMRLSRTSGKAFALGRNYTTNPNYPSVVTDGNYTNTSITRYYRGATAGTFITVPNQTVIDPGFYDNGTGTLAVVSGGQFTIKRIFYFPGQASSLGVYYGRQTYNSMDVAKANLFLEEFSEIENTLYQAIFCAYLIVKGNATDLTNTAEAQFIQGGLFRNTSSGGGGLSTTSLDDLSDVTITSAANDQVLTYESGQWVNRALSTLPVVSSINGLTGALNLAAGSNITITPSGLTLTIASTGGGGVTSYVSSFNGLTGAVTGVTTGTANTFGPLQSFTSGISSAGGTFSALTRFTAGISAAGGMTLASRLYVDGNIITSPSGVIESGFNGWFRGLQWVDPNGGRARIVLNYSSTPRSIDFKVDGISFDGSGELTRMQLFASGLSCSAGATFGGSIILQNNEFIRNTTDGRIDFMPAPGGSTHYGLSIDTTSWGFGPRLGTIRSSDNALNTAAILWDVPLTLAANVRFNFGSNGQNGVVLSDTGNDTIQFFTNVTSGTNSGAVAIVDAAGINSANRAPGTTHTNPNLYIYRAGNARATDFIRFEHDGNTGFMVSGGTTDIALRPGSGIVGVSGNIQVLQNQIYVTNNARSWFL